MLPYWTCPGCHAGRAVHLAAGILVLQVPLVIAVTSLFYSDLWLIVVYIVLVDYLVCKCDSEAARGKLKVLDMSQLPRGWHIHLAAGILVLQEYLVIAITSLFYIVHRLIVVYIVLVGYLVSKCDSEVARGKLNSLSDPNNIHVFNFTRDAFGSHLLTYSPTLKVDKT
jgi:hypothetical protein